MRRPTCMHNREYMPDGTWSHMLTFNESTHVRVFCHRWQAGMTDKKARMF